MLDGTSLKWILKPCKTINKRVDSMNVIISYFGHSINNSDEFKIKEVNVKKL